MYWEDGSEAWRHFEVVRQPAAALMTADGTVVRTWSGSPDPDEILDAIENI